MNTDFDQLVFSGGGTRCFWQGGFLDVVRDAIDLKPDRISGVSGGALGSAAFISHRGADLLTIMKDAFARQDGNTPLHERSGEAGLTLHQRVYREVAEETLTAAALSDITNGPKYQILIGHPPPGGKLTAVAATAAYEAELHIVGAPHFNWAERIGATSTLVDGRQAARDGTLTDLCCAAAVIPPIFDSPVWDSKPVIDGGMIDQAPLPDPSKGRTLVLLTRDYDRIPDVEDRLYIAPQSETPADKIDFTDPDKIQRTWDIGRDDGRAWLDAR